MGRLFTGAYSPATLGSFLRTFTFGHTHELDAVASRWLGNLAVTAPITTGVDRLALVDIDDTIKAVHGYRKQSAGFGYSGLSGLNALIGTVSTPAAAPVVIGARPSNARLTPSIQPKQRNRKAPWNTRGVCFGNGVSGISSGLEQLGLGQPVPGSLCRVGLRVAGDLRVQFKQILGSQCGRYLVQHLGKLAAVLA